MANPPSIIVVGSVNLDIVATTERLPVAGETITGAELHRFPGGKGANQALAARRLGADVSLIACVGRDADADVALALLKEGKVGLGTVISHATAPTGVALICVSRDGENHIVVAPGANRELRAEDIIPAPADALICQLEVPMPTIEHAIGTFEGFICVNLAPAAAVSGSFLDNVDLIVVNETEALFYEDQLPASNALVARTLGANGAELLRGGEVIARAAAPGVAAVDATGAGDTFTAALTVALVEAQAPQLALQFACAAGALAVTRAGAQPSLPYRQEVEALLQ